jgi:hypothetical protein
VYFDLVEDTNKEMKRQVLNGVVKNFFPHMNVPTNNSNLNSIKLPALPHINHGHRRHAHYMQTHAMEEKVFPFSLAMWILFYFIFTQACLSRESEYDKVLITFESVFQASLRCVFDD